MIELEYLTEDPRIIEVCEAYWKLGDEDRFVYTVSQLAEETGLKRKDLLRLVQANSRARSADSACQACGEAPLLGSRADYSAVRKRNRAFVCNKCLAKKEEESKAQARNLAEKRAANIRKMFTRDLAKPPVINTLSLEQSVYILSFVRAGAAEDMSYINRLVDFNTPLTPTDSLDKEVVDVLRQAGLIDIHPGSPYSCFEFEGDMPARYTVRDVYWQLYLGRDVSEVRSFVGELEEIFREMDWPDTWATQSTSLWKKVATHEAVEYLKYCLDEHSIPFSPEERTFTVIENLLESFSVAQIYNIIWRLSKDSAAFLSRTSVPRERGADYAVVGMQKFGDRARVEHWDIKPYRRCWDLPVSMVAEVLYNTVLHTDGFNIRPS